MSQAASQKPLFVAKQQLLSDQDHLSDNTDEDISPREGLSSPNLNDSILSPKSLNNRRVSIVESTKDPHTLSQQMYERNLENLNLCVDSIKGQFGHILNKHEQDFIRAYQSYMEKVQKELAFLQNRVNETLKTEMNDGYISSLNRIIDMFVAESEHVNETLNVQKVQFRALKDQRTQIKRDRKALKEEIACEMRENKQYQIATNKVQRKNEVLRTFLQMNATSKIVNVEIKPQLTAQINQQKEPKLKQSVKEYIMSLFDQGLTKEQVEVKVIEYFKAKDKKKDRKIAYSNRQLDSLRRYNYRAHTQHAQGYSEKAEVESIFLDSVDEVKKDIAKQISTKMAMHLTSTSTAKDNQKQNEFKLARLSAYMKNPSKILLEQTVSQKMPLMDLFEDMFGHGGYSGAAFQKFSQQMREKQGYTVLEDALSNTSSQRVQPTKFLNLLQNKKVDESIQIVNQTIAAPPDVLKKTQTFNSRRSKERQMLLSTGTNKMASNLDAQSANTYFTSNRQVSTAKGGRRSDATAAAMVNFLNQSVIDEYQVQKTSNIENSNSNMSPGTFSHYRNGTQQYVSSFNPSEVYLNHTNQKPLNLTQQQRMTVTSAQKRATSISVTTNGNTTRKPFTVKNGKLMVNTDNNTKVTQYNNLFQ